MVCRMYSITKEVAGMHFLMVRLVQPDPTGVVVVYPSLEDEACFVALTQSGPDKGECPIAFVARYLTKTELKYGTLTTLVSVAAWAIRRLCRYTTFAKEVHVILPTTVDV